MKDVGADGAVMRWGKVFGVVIGEIDVTWCPEDVEVALTDTVTNPIKTHVHGSAAFLFDGVIGNAIGACIVGLNGSGWLWVSHGDEDGA